MHITKSNWMQVEEQLRHDDRAVLPLGSTEQHAYLSLSVDSLLAEKMATDAAAPLNVPVFPVLAYGLTPYFRAYPGTLSLRVSTYLAILRDVLDGLAEQGFRRILIVNGHGGNNPGSAFCEEWVADCAATGGALAGVRVKWHNWWNAPNTWARVQAIDPLASHASWMENFPWTRLPGVQQPDGKKAAVDVTAARHLAPGEMRALLGDGNFAGAYQKPDEDMLALWQTGVTETRARLSEGW